MTILDRLQALRPLGSSVILLAFLIIAPITLAHASPPDPTWLAGVYDQADFDDVVGLLTSACGAIDCATAPDADPSLALAPKLCQVMVAWPAPAPRLLGATPRSPDRVTIRIRRAR